MGEGGCGIVHLLVGKFASDRVAKKTSLKAKGKEPAEEFKLLREEGAIHKVVHRLATRRQRSEQFLGLVSMWFFDRCGFWSFEFIYQSVFKSKVIITSFFLN